MNKFLAGAFAAALLMPAAGHAQSVLCDDDLAETKKIFLERRANFSLEAQHDIAQLLKTYDSRCHTDSGGGHVASADLARIRAVLNGHAQLSELPGPLGSGTGTDAGIPVLVQPAPPVYVQPAPPAAVVVPPGAVIVTPR